MVLVVPIIVLVAIAAGALLYTARARREAQETAAELDRLQQRHETLDLPEPPDQPPRDGQ